MHDVGVDAAPEHDWTTGPLAGCLVADFSRVLAGPLATMVLGDLGATVVKVEHPRGDDTRQWGPPFADGESTYYLSVNRNKRSVVLDLATDDGLGDARLLARRATVLIENFRPGRFAELGLGYDELTRENPRLVYCSISGFGGPGTPGAALAGYDFVAQAMSGLMDVTGPPGGPPYKVGVAVVDVLTGLHAAIGILAALASRARSGRGQLVEIDLFSTALASLVNQASAFVNAGVLPHALGNRHPSITPYETLAALDGDLAVAVGNDIQFRALCRALGCDELATDERFATNPARVAHHEPLVTALETQLGRYTVAAAVATLRTAGVPCGPVNDVRGALDDATALGLDPVVHMVDGMRRVATIASPLRLSDTPVSYRKLPPRLGQDTDEVIAWLRTPDTRPLDPPD